MTSDRVSGRLDDNVLEYVDHLHEHFDEPVVVKRGHYRLPSKPGYASMRRASLRQYRYPDGPVWSAREAPTNG